MSKLDEMIPIATVLDLTEIIPHYGQRVVVEYQIGIFFTSMSLENDVNDGQTSIDRDTKNNGMIFNRSHNNELYNEKLITK